MVETSDLKLVKSAMCTALTDMVLLFDQYHFNALTICQDEDAQKLQLALAQKASLLRTVCDEAGGLEIDVGRISTMTARKRIAQDHRKENGALTLL